MTGRAAPSVTLVGDRYVVVFAGTKGDTDANFAQRGGAVFDRATGEWAPMAEPPFPEPLFQPAAIAAGGELIVVGAPCREASNYQGESGWSCTADAERVAASYDPSADRWDVIETSGALPDASRNIEAWPIGRVGPEVVFSMPMTPEGLFSYNTETKGWRHIPKVPGGALVCATSDSLVAITGFTGRPTKEEEYGAYEHVTFTYRDDRWTRVARDPERAPGQEFAASQCGDGSAMYVASRPNGEGAPYEVLPLWWYESHDEGWRQAPEVDIAPGSSIDGATLGSGAQLLELSEGQRPMRVLSRSDVSPNWSEREVPSFGRTRIDAGEDSFLLVPHDPLKDGLFIGTVD